MLNTLLFGLVASSALVIGGVAGAFWRPPRRLVAVVLAFASGSLITALATDLLLSHSRLVARGYPGSGFWRGRRPLWWRMGSSTVI